MTKEEARDAIVKAADRWRNEVTTDAHAELVRAVDDYRKATRPTLPGPFEAFVGYYNSDPYPGVFNTSPAGADAVWLGIVTPIERVR